MTRSTRQRPALSVRPISRPAGRGGRNAKIRSGRFPSYRAHSFVHSDGRTARDDPPLMELPHARSNRKRFTVSILEDNNTTASKFD